MDIFITINAFEDKYGLKLPESYKNFLQQNTWRNANCIVSNQKAFFIRNFFKLKSQNMVFSLEEINKKLWEDPDIFPQHCIAIGEDSFGNFYCIDLHNDNYGSVFFFDTEFYDDKENKFVVITTNFEDFEKNLSI